MSSLFDENRKVYVCDDFNIWAEDDTDNYTKRFLEVIGNLITKMWYVNLLPGLDIYLIWLCVMNWMMTWWKYM